ncbi:MAG: alpha-glucosidase [Candidatus Limnocylindrales bacterium]|nr:alpha-glucosidase [Candidatus Limnocylindrales bacterium]
MPKVLRRAPTPGMSPAVRPAPPVVGAAFGDDWWRRGVIYQVYPRSFADSNDDGVGDLPGLIEKLDYLNDGTQRSLGVDAIWLSPIHPSPGFDVGYDVADYDAIDPLFGALEDFDRLVAEAHRRGIRILLDLVMNHTSLAHRWFEESRRDPSGPFGDWYLWRDGVRDRFGRVGKPNNWTSFFGGSAWTWDATRGQFYMHTFLPEQPDVNWRNPALRAAMLTMVRRWLERGVDGFRLDVFNAFFKHADLPSNPRRYLGRRPYDRQLHLYDKDRPELVDFLVDFRALVDSYPERMTVGELFSADPALAARLSAPRHLVFDFGLIRQRWRAEGFAAASDEHEQRFGPDGWPTIVLSNHDQSRQASRLAPGADAGTSDAIARAACVLSLTLRGTPFLYYGEEIGARDVPVPWSEIIDPPARRGGRIVRRIVPWWNRDQARSPMPWGDGPNGGFSPVRPWLRMAPDVETRTMAIQDGDPVSVLSTYRRMVWLRRRHPALQVGAYRRLAAASRGVFAFERTTADEAMIVAVNFAAAPTSFRVRTGRRWSVAFDTHHRATADISGGDRLTLGPREAIVLLAG